MEQEHHYPYFNSSVLDFAVESTFRKQITNLAWTADLYLIAIKKDPVVVESEHRSQKHLLYSWHTRGIKEEYRILVLLR